MLSRSSCKPTTTCHVASATTAARPRPAVADDGSMAGRDAAGMHRHVDFRQIERERAALDRDALQVDFAAQQAGDFAADGQAQAGAAIAAAGAAVGLLEGLENDLLLVGRNADAGVRDREGDHAAGAVQAFVVVPPAAGDARLTLSVTLPRSVNLKALDNRFLSTCCNRFRSVRRPCGRSSAKSIVELQLARFRPRGGTCDRRSRADPRTRSGRRRRPPCRIRSSTDRGCR